MNLCGHELYKSHRLSHFLILFSREMAKLCKDYFFEFLISFDFRIISQNKKGPYEYKFIIFSHFSSSHNFNCFYDTSNLHRTNNKLIRSKEPIIFNLIAQVYLKISFMPERNQKTIRTLTTFSPV